MRAPSLARSQRARPHVAAKAARFRATGGVTTPTHSPLDDSSLVASLAMFAGVFPQVVARHVNVPGIVLLLVALVILGPDVANVIRPEALGSGLSAVVGMAVAVILFEGGLSLDLRVLRRQQKPIQRLVLFGSIVTALDAVGATIAVVALEVLLAPPNERVGTALVGIPRRFGVGTLVGVLGGAVFASPDALSQRAARGPRERGSAGERAWRRYAACSIARPWRPL